MKTNRHIAYPELIAYAKGELSNSQNYKIEKHLNTCKMCADIADGLSLLTPEELDRKLLILTTGAGKKGNKKRGFIYLPIAASIALLIGFGFWFFTSDINESKQFAEKVEKKEVVKKKEVESNLEVEGDKLAKEEISELENLEEDEFTQPEVLEEPIPKKLKEVIVTEELISSDTKTTIIQTDEITNVNFSSSGTGFATTNNGSENEDDNIDYKEQDVKLGLGSTASFTDANLNPVAASSNNYTIEKPEEEITELEAKTKSLKLEKLKSDSIEELAITVTDAPADNYQFRSEVEYSNEIIESKREKEEVVIESNKANFEADNKTELELSILEKEKSKKRQEVTISANSSSKEDSDTDVEADKFDKELGFNRTYKAISSKTDTVLQKNTSKVLIHIKGIDFNAKNKYELFSPDNNYIPRVNANNELLITVKSGIYQLKVNGQLINQKINLTSQEFKKLELILE